MPKTQKPLLKTFKNIVNNTYVLVDKPEQKLPLSFP